MFDFPPTIIFRHRRENLKKCSLSGLEKKEGLLFFTYPKDPLPLVSDYILLQIDAPPLSKSDDHLGLFLIDGTWRLAEKITRQLPKESTFLTRSFPSHFKTAYPRRQEDCPLPERGLASVEALFIAYHLMGRNTEGILNHYFWKEEFLKKNASYL
jgi:pre-rRNA-processing protein TSR3